MLEGAPHLRANKPTPMRLATQLPLAALLLAAPLAAQTPGDCTPGRAEKTLDAGDARGTVYNTGTLFARDSGPNYFVPAFQDVSPLYVASLWVGGMVGAELRTAGATYDNYEFWPGPLNADGSLPNPTDCSAYDRIWKVSAADLALYEATGVATADLNDWPFELGAEVMDGDGVEGNYDLAAGDRPRVYGTQTAFWVMNDVGNTHEGTGAPPIGLEVRVHAFAVSAKEPALDQATFYRYTLVNRNALALDSARFTLFADPDLGETSDDYIGSDTTRGLGFVYNADNDDTGSNGYGVAPPAAGFDLLDGLGVFTYFNGSCCGMSDPTTAQEYYNYASGRWKDGTPLFEGGDGYDEAASPVTTFAFPGDAATGAFWSEQQSTPGGPANQPGDRRFVAGSAAFTLQPGEARTFSVALLFARGASNTASVAAL